MVTLFNDKQKHVYICSLKSLLSLVMSLNSFSCVVKQGRFSAVILEYHNYVLDYKYIFFPHFQRVKRLPYNIYFVQEQL